MRTKLITLAAVTLIGATACSPGGPGSPSGGNSAAAQAEVAFEPEPIEWDECDTEALTGLGAECGFLTVPLDYGAQDGDTIQLAVSRLKHTAKKADYQGAIVLNPGGPGGSGRDLVSVAGTVKKKAAAAYDWIGLDLRGIGASKPALSCDVEETFGEGPTKVPQTDQQEQEMLEQAAAFGEQCAKDSGPLLDHMKTTDNAKDLEVLRKALGQEEISFIGYSYGSYLGQVYATQYPQRVDRMIMDGVVDPQNVWYDSGSLQARSLEENFDAFFAKIAEADDVLQLGGSAEAVKEEFLRQREKLNANPEGGDFGGEEWTNAFLILAYNAQAWQTAGVAFAQWVHEGDIAGARELSEMMSAGSDALDVNANTVFMATTCTDAPWAKDWTTIEKDIELWGDQAPLLSGGSAMSAAICLEWDGDVGEPIQVDGSEAPPVLLISETNDGPTPFEGALATRSLFPNSVLVEGVNGYSHSASGSGSSCTTDIISEYLLTGDLPKRTDDERNSDVQCEPSFRWE
nr:alpha/beta fold hydrolase [Kineosporia babensis]